MTARIVQRICGILIASAIVSVIWAFTSPRLMIAQDNDATKPRPYVAATILSHEDGTGFGTPAAPWLTRENGFPVGDEGPHDGVVTTGDTVHYRVRLAFQAAKARTVTISVASSKYLTTASGDVCPSGVNVTGRASSSGCVYDIPAGAAESVDVDLYMTAGDTAGQAVTGVKPELRLARSGGAVDSLLLGALTVVSARNADLVVDNGALSGKEIFGYACGEDTSIDSKFNLNVVPLMRSGYTTTHGSSTTFPWSAIIDVSDWPENTIWRIGDKNGKVISPVGGMLHLPEIIGNTSLYYSTPTKDNAVGDHVYDIHAIVQSGFPQGQPGDNQKRDVSTYDKSLGSSDGRPYANNDWSRSKQRREAKCGPKVDTYGDELSLAFPYNENYALWDDNNLEPPFRMYKSYATRNGSPNAAMKVGIGTKIQARVLLAPFDPGFGYDRWSFDKGLEFTSLPEVIDRDGNIANSTEYSIRYGTDVDAGEHDNGSIWFDDPRLSNVPPADLSTIRVICVHRFNNDKLFNADMTWNLIASGEGVNRVSGLGSPGQKTTSYLIHDGTVTVNKPGLWTVKADTGDTSAEPYDTVTTDITPWLADVPSSTLDMTADLNVCASNGLAKTSISGSGWTLTPTVKTECGSAWNAHWTGKSNANRSGNGYLPSLEVIGVVKPTATFAQTVSINGTVSSKEQGEIKARMQNLVATRAITVTASAKAASSVDTGMNEENPKLLDPGTEIHGTARLYVHGQHSTGPASMVIKLPGNDYSLYNSGKGPDGTWHEYDRGYTTLRNIKLTKEPSLDTDLSGQATLQYATDTTVSLDPSKLTWKNAAAITDWSKVTAILVTASTDKTVDTAAASVNIFMNADPKTEGQGNFWVSAPYVDGKSLTSTPWPGTVAYKYAQASGILFNDTNSDGQVDKTERGAAEQDTEHTGKIYIYHSDENGKEGAPVMSEWDPSQPKWASLDHYGWRLSYLTSGWWLVKTTIDPTKQNGDGIIGYSTTYYNTTDHLTATTPTTRLIHLNVGQNLTDIDFGIRYDKPQVTVTQSTARDGCEGDSCKVTVNTTVENVGPNTLSADKAILHSRSKRDKSDDDIVWNETRFARIHDRTAIDTNGHVWANNSNGWTAHAGCRGQWCRIDMGRTKIIRAARDYGGDIYAIDSDGRFLACSSYCTNKYSREMSYGDRQPLAWSGNAWVEPFPTGVTRWKNVAVPYEGTNIYNVLLEAQDGSLWYFSSVYNDQPFIKLDTPNGVTFDLDAADGLYWLAFPGSDGKLYSYTGASTEVSHPLFELATTCLSGKSNAGCLFAWPTPDGGPTAVQEVTMNEADGRLTAIVLDKDGSIWELGTDDYEFKEWKNITPDGYKVRHILSSSTDSGGPVWFIGQDDKLYRYNHDWSGWHNLAYGSYGEIDPKNDDSVTPYLPNETFSSMVNMSTNRSDWHPVALSSDGRPYSWGRLYDDTTKQDVVYDPFDSTPSDHSADATQHVSTTAPVTTITTDGWTTNDYAMPYDLAPGDEYTLRRTFTVPKGKEATVMAVQSWLDSPDTPYSGIKTHLAANLDKPNLPDTTKFGNYMEYGPLDDNSSCLMRGHQFSGYESMLEDSCEQSAARIPATATTPIIGSISGLAWRDVNGDGRRQSDEPVEPNVHVTIRAADGSNAGMTTTSSDGSYKFDGLAAGEYIAWFATDNKNLTWTTRISTDPSTSDDDSDVSSSPVDYGSTTTLTVNATKTDWTHVDAGLTTRKQLRLPITGRIGMIILVILLPIMIGGSIVFARRR